MESSATSNDVSKKASSFTAVGTAENGVKRSGEEDSGVQFIIVADKDLAPFGRQLAHNLSEQEDHDGAFCAMPSFGAA